MRVMVVCWVVMGVMGCSVSPGSVRADEPEPVLEGQALFEEACVNCHDGVMKYMHTGPHLLALSWDEERVEKARGVIREGEDPGMPAFEETLSEAQIESILEYLQENADPSLAREGHHH